MVMCNKLTIMLKFILFSYFAICTKCAQGDLNKWKNSSWSGIEIT